jgi:hypothetical protein
MPYFSALICFILWRSHQNNTHYLGAIKAVYALDRCLDCEGITFTELQQQLCLKINVGEYCRADEVIYWLGQKKYYGVRDLTNSSPLLTEMFL